MAVLLLVTALTGSPASAAGPNAPTVDIYDTYAIEGSGETVIALVLSQAAPTAVRVTASAQDGTAAAGSDYQASTTVVEFTPGSTRRNFIVSLVDDAVAEPDESLTVALSAPNGVLIGDGSAVVVIVDDVAESSPPGERDCSDGNSYTDDAYDSAAGYCTHTLGTVKDLDEDGRAASQAGGPDCNDADPAVRPGATDVPGNGIDEDCDGKVDGAGPRNCDDGYPYTNDRYKKRKGHCTHKLQAEADLDGDGWVAAQVGGADCDDDRFGVRPGAPEVDNGRDDDCDGLVDSPGPGPSESVRPIDIGPPPDCPAGDVCTSYVVECGTGSTRGLLARSATIGDPRGVVVLFSGGDGDTFLGGQGSDGDETVDELQAAGLEVYRASWPDTWNTLDAAPFGLDQAACTASTLIDYLHTEVFLPLELPEDDGVCGFCIGGNSGGATQVAYAISHYGQDDILDAAVMSSGPILAALAQGCLNTDPEFKISTNIRHFADLAYGFSDGVSGPCVQRDPAMEPTWRADSILDGGDDYVHPTTRVVFLIGGLDNGSAPGNADAYADRLIAAGSPSVTEQLFPNAGHGITEFLSDPQARAAFIEAFTVPEPALSRPDPA